MPDEPLDIAVIGHTNTGKTSLMRTLTRRRDFGAISTRPATTRHVERAELDLPGAVLRLYDTPGLEDSTGLLAHLDELHGARGGDRTDAIDALIAEAEAQAGFAQEAKALGQLRASHLAFYVVDARDRVRARHRDELEVLARSAVPVLPVLNFIAAPDAREAAWRSQLARVNMHAVVAFDTVVYDEAGEIALYRKIASLIDRAGPAIERLIEEITARRRRIRRASARMIADMLIDAAAAERSYRREAEGGEDAAVAELRSAVRARETRLVGELLALHGFGEDDYRLRDLPLDRGAWAEDLFDPDALARFGLATGTAAATGAAAGVAVDFALGGVTLGGGAAAGAGAGFLLETARRHGSALAGRFRGTGVVRLDEASLALLAARQVMLLEALLRRGHGAVTPIGDLEPDPQAGARLARRAKRARGERRWSRLNTRDSEASAASRRDTLTETLADAIEAGLEAPAG